MSAERTASPAPRVRRRALLVVAWLRVGLPFLSGLVQLLVKSPAMSSS